MIGRFFDQLFDEKTECVIGAIASIVTSLRYSERKNPR